MESQIKEFYKNKSVFLTGGSGFIGQIIIEKLLRCCDIKAIYVLIRNKKDRSWEQRLKRMLNDPLYDHVRKVNPEFKTKIIGVVGDCTVDDYGLSPNDKRMLYNNINVVLHAAATVRFDEKLSTALKINVQGTQTLIELCKNMRFLNAFVYISTAYSNCNRFVIEEKFYEPNISALKILQLMKNLNDEALNNITPQIIKGFPNTYTFTKHIAEDLVSNYAGSFPAVVFRPSIVMSTYKEPVTGWINNYYGPIGLMYGISVGAIHTFHLDKKVNSPIVPVDMTVNALLASAWDAAQQKHASIQIYNFVPKQTNQITWEKFTNINLDAAANFPVSYCYWYYVFETYSNPTKAKIMHFLYHIFPAFFIDLILVMLRRKFRLMRIYRKIGKLYDVLAFFTTNNFSWHDKNLQILWEKLSPTDKHLFFFDMEKLHWQSYLYSSLLGMRFYVAKDDPSTIPVALRRQKLFKMLHYSLIYSMKFLALSLFTFVVWTTYISSVFCI